MTLKMYFKASKDLKRLIFCRLFKEQLIYIKKKPESKKKENIVFYIFLIFYL